MVLGTAAAAAVPAQSGSVLPHDKANQVVDKVYRYYHPGNAGLTCQVGFDWDTLRAQQKIVLPPEIVPTLKALQVEVTSRPDQTPTFRSTWPPDAPAVLQTSFDGLAQKIITGFLEIYWPYVNAGFLPGHDDHYTLMRLPNGSYSLHMPLPANADVHVTDKFIVTEVASDTTEGRRVVKLHFHGEPSPTDADALQLDSLETTAVYQGQPVSGKISWEYEQVGQMYYPSNIHFDSTLASITMHFSGCRRAFGRTINPDDSK